MLIGDCRVLIFIADERPAVDAAISNQQSAVSNLIVPC
jgi:hypothetical protein